MPKRTTLTFTSEDAPAVEEGKLFAYHCKYSGRHALTLDIDLKKLPRRRTDGSYVVDTQEHTVKLYTSDGGIKLIKRHNGKVERQYRYNIGKLPVAYRTEEAGRYLYVLDDAVSSYNNQSITGGDKVMVPPCIKRSPNGATTVRMEVEDRSHTALLARVTADAVRLHITINMGLNNSNEEIYELMARVLGVRLAQLSIVKGNSSRVRILTVDNLSPEQVFEKIQQHLGKLSRAAEANKAERGGGR